MATQAAFEVNDGYIAIVDQQVMQCWIQMLESPTCIFIDTSVFRRDYEPQVIPTQFQVEDIEHFTRLHQIFIG